MSIFPLLEDVGKQAAEMLVKIFRGTAIEQIPAQWPRSGIAFDLKKTEQFTIPIPQELLEKAQGNIIP